MYEPPFVLPGSNFPPPPVDYVETLARFTAAGDGGAACHQTVTQEHAPGGSLHGHADCEQKSALGVALTLQRPS